MALGRAGRAASVGLLVALGCGVQREPERRDALEVIATLAAREPSLAWMRARNAASFGRHDGAIASEVWRNPGRGGRLEERIGVRLPSSAEGIVDVTVARSTRLRLRARLDGAAATPASLREGSVVYERALPSTDRVFAANATTLEELLVLHDARAPRSFAWKIEHDPGIAGAARDARGIRFHDAQGQDRLTIAAPRAWDASGADVPLRFTYDATSASLTIALATTPAAWPVVVDPTYETTVWFDTERRSPPAAARYPMTFDAARGQTVLLNNRETWTWNGARWRRNYAATTPSNRTLHAMTYDSVRKEVVLFGGCAETGDYLGDTWTWNGSTWSLRGPAASPPARCSAQLAFDSTRGEAVLFGGQGASRFDDTWTWDGTTWTQRTPASSPPGRTGHVMAFDPSRGRTVLFGGVATSYLGDTWSWNGATWTLLGPFDYSPPSRASATMAFDTERNALVLYGGYPLVYDGESHPFNDTVVLDENGWRDITSIDTPGGRYGHAMAYDAVRKRMFIFGGTSDDFDFYFNDTYALDPDDNWLVVGAASKPPARSSAAAAYDATRGNVVLFAGQGQSGTLGDTWTWDGVDWRWRASSGPAARFNHAMAYDAARGEVVMFGGTKSSAANAETWAWNGATWAQRSPATSPPARSFHAMTFDAARGEVLLFGGPPDDLTWVWNGVTWASRAPVTRPGPRTQPSFAYDAERREAVLFGGFAPNRKVLNDTWTWNGATWTLRSPTVVPAPRAGAAMAYDSERAQVIMFGGGLNSAQFADTWIWDGTTWAIRSSLTAPGLRVAASAAYDAARNQTVLFGGLGAGDIRRNDTWIHLTTGAECTSDDDCGDSFCTDGVCCNVQSCGTCASCNGLSPGRCAPVVNQEDSDSCAARDGKSCSAAGECKAALGVAATSAAECASNHVVDGVCCFDACEGTCQSCRADLKESGDRSGFCGATMRGTDPDEQCAPDAAATCGRDGTCDGRGACALYAADTPCGAGGAVCSGAGRCDLPKEGSCDGDHTVIAADGTPSDCGLYRCEGSACKMSCTRKSDCVDDADCNFEGKCVGFDPAASDDSGCTTTPARRAPSAGLVGAALAALVARSVRRRRCTTGAPTRE